jgi:hypothetical protein
VGLLLAKRLAGASLPEHISARIDADLMSGSLSRKALDVVAKTPVNPDVDPSRYLFYFKAKDCRLDQLLFAGRLMAMLTAGEWNPAPLPDCLFPVSFCFRPVGLMLRHGRYLLGRVSEGPRLIKSQKDKHISISATQSC